MRREGTKEKKRKEKKKPFRSFALRTSTDTCQSAAMTPFCLCNKQNDNREYKRKGRIGRERFFFFFSLVFHFGFLFFGFNIWLNFFFFKEEECILLDIVFYEQQRKEEFQ